MRDRSQLEMLESFFLAELNYADETMLTEKSKKILAKRLARKVRKEFRLILTILGPQIISSLLK